MRDSLVVMTSSFELKTSGWRRAFHRIMTKSSIVSLAVTLSCIHHILSSLDWFYSIDTIRPNRCTPMTIYLILFSICPINTIIRIHFLPSSSLNSSILLEIKLTHIIVSIPRDRILKVNHLRFQIFDMHI